MEPVGHDVAMPSHRKCQMLQRNVLLEMDERCQRISKTHKNLAKATN
jgi:hypothetical protein